MKVMITGGGTGGHLSVAKAFLEEFYQRGYTCFFMGSIGGQDRAYFEEDSRLFKKYFLHTGGVVNQKGFKKIFALFSHFRAFLLARKILKSEKIDFVFSVGGYSAAPAAFGAVFLRIPLIIHEQNAKIGRLNKILKPYAKLFFSSYLEDSLIKFYPVQKDFFQYSRTREQIQNILFMGGSQGAQAINNFALKVVLELKKRGIRVYHQCGKGDFKRVLSEYEKMPLKVTHISNIEDLQGNFDVAIFDFCKFMPQVFMACDFAISRAGASSLWELCANGLMTLFVPYPYAAANHQYFNAKFLKDRKLGFLCEEKDLSCEVLWDILSLSQRDIKQISQALQKECNANAVKEMADCVEVTLRSQK